MKYFMFAVAPRMGSVDRNNEYGGKSIKLTLSLPAWGAWIEISGASGGATSGVSRSPHGERG